MSREYNQYIRVFTGRKFWPLDPHLEEIDILDIAHALANNCRWGGHCGTFFSIAQHCCIVHDFLPERLKRAGLLHDASEAYILDMPRPIKYQMPEYRVIEDILMRKIAERFQFDYALLEEIKGADDLVLYIEKSCLFRDGDPREVLTDRAVDFYFESGHDYESMQQTIWAPEQAEAEFLNRFHWLHLKW